LAFGNNQQPAGTRAEQNPGAPPEKTQQVNAQRNKTGEKQTSTKKTKENNHKKTGAA
jgi:hypothetical protein